jgi:hypothetical protein
MDDLFSDDPESAIKIPISDVIKLTVSRLSLILDFLYTRDHEFMDDFKLTNYF